MSVVVRVRAAAPIRIATEYAERSPVGRVLLSAAQALHDKTGLAATVVFDQPDPDLLLRQLQDGTLDGALLGADAHRQLAPRLVSCHTPGQFSDMQALSSYRTRQTPVIRSQIESRGTLRFVGHAHLMQRRILSSREIRLPVDLQRWRVLVRPGDVMAEAARKRLGLAPVQARLPDWARMLASGEAEGALASAYEAAQWSLTPHVKYLHDIPWSGAVGVICLSQRTMARLDSGRQNALVSVCEKAGAVLADRLADEDAAALKSLRAKVSVTRSGSRQQRIWRRHFDVVVEALPAAYRPPAETAPRAAPPPSRERQLSPDFRIDPLGRHR